MNMPIMVSRISDGMRKMCPSMPEHSSETGISIMAALTRGEHSKFAISEKNAKVPKCSRMTGAVVT